MSGMKSAFTRGKIRERESIKGDFLAQFIIPLAAFSYLLEKHSQVFGYFIQYFLQCRKLTQDRDRWRALVYTVMNLRVP
jgi:hypothetical protein